LSGCGSLRAERSDGRFSGGAGVPFRRSTQLVSAANGSLDLGPPYVDDVVTVPDAATARAVKYLLDRMKLVAEPSGAITIAALLERLVTPRGPTVAVLSGGNIEWDGLTALLAGA